MVMHAHEVSPQLLIIRVCQRLDHELLDAQEFRGQGQGWGSLGFDETSLEWSLSRFLKQKGLGSLRRFVVFWDPQNLVSFYM